MKKRQSSNIIIVQILLLLTILIHIQNETFAQEKDSAQEAMNLRGIELIRMRGYIAEDHYFITSDGFVINMIKVINPLIKSKKILKKKDVVLIIHGLTTSAKCFVLNTDGAEPKDYSKLDASKMDQDELNDLLQDDDSARSIVFLLSNFAHEVWLMNRRCVSDSIKETIRLSEEFDKKVLVNLDDKVVDQLTKEIKKNSNKEAIKNKKKFIPAVFDRFRNLIYDHKQKYWNFSYDEQAVFDFPETIDYVLKKTKRKQLAIIGHSAGGQLILMGLALNPNIIDKCK